MWLLTSVSRLLERELGHLGLCKSLCPMLVRFLQKYPLLGYDQEQTSVHDAKSPLYLPVTRVLETIRAEES